MTEMNHSKQQIGADIVMADTHLSWSDMIDLEWKSTDALTGAWIKGLLTEREDKAKFYVAVFIAISGEDEILEEEQYEDLEKLLGFTGDNKNHPARWIP